MRTRASAPVIGVVVLLLVGIVLGGVVAAGAEAVATATGGVAAGSDARDTARPSPVAVSLYVDGDTVALTHEAGAPLRLARVRLVVEINGEPLAHQPPVPFFAASGFGGGPTGPFNVASDGVWAVGETGSFRIAGTNDPQLEPGRTVSVTVYVGENRVSRVRGTVG
ncbi:type IV pilin [Halobellus sp. H-GB7]|uniref:type IV pilin n=1 Tax=Halobellus sp. H-GB7 TaxID=3069756 RepID=UPI0027B30A3C|nr:type IV pilin [Halobellus sp. H-GB7]MDQ2054923.1 type IV pilin [Halobellus sp. H-GB7]